MRYETISTLSNETFLITPLEEGQALHFNGNRITSPAGEPIRVYGTGPVEISQGAWGQRARFAGEYFGDYFDGNTQSTVSAELLDIQRQIGGGPWITLARDLALNDALTDPLPDLAQPNHYRAITKTSLPTEAIGEEVVFTAECTWPGPQFFVNGGPGFGMVCTSRGSATEDAPTIGVAHHQFVGNEYPTAFFDEHSTQNISFGGRLMEESTPPAGWHNLLQQRGTTCIRDWLGRRVFGTLSFTLPHSDHYTSINGDVFRTEFREEEYWDSQAQET